MDRYHSHTAICKSCTGALNNFNRLQTALEVRSFISQFLSRRPYLHTTGSDTGRDPRRAGAARRRCDTSSLAHWHAHMSGTSAGGRCRPGDGCGRRRCRRAHRRSVRLGLDPPPRTCVRLCIPRALPGGIRLIAGPPGDSPNWYTLICHTHIRLVCVHVFRMQRRQRHLSQALAPPELSPPMLMLRAGLLASAALASRISMAAVSSYTRRFYSGNPSPPRNAEGLRLGGKGKGSSGASNAADVASGIQGKK